MKYDLKISATEKMLMTLGSMAGMAVTYDAKRKAGEPMFAEDVEESMLISSFLAALANELFESNPAALNFVFAHAANIHKDDQNFDAEIANAHDCDACGKAGSCPIEAQVRALKEAGNVH